MNIVRRGRLSFLRLRALLGWVALLVLVDIGGGLGVNALNLDTPVNNLAHPDAPAGRHEPWARTLGEEITRAATEKRYDPYLSWTASHFHGKYLNVANGVRRSYEPAGPTAKSDVKVFFFGGSAMYGSFQRDQHTIPSEVARLAAADGIRVRVANYAQPAYVNWQEILLLEQLVTRGSTPDLAVFYDGFNELLNQFKAGLHSEPSHFEALERGEKRDASPLRALYDAWAKVSALNRSARRIFQSVHREPLPSHSIGGGQDVGRYAAALYSRGRDVAHLLAQSYGSRASFFWQPFIYGKRVVPGEKDIIGAMGEDAQVWRRANDAARSQLDPSVTDLSTALDGVQAPVMYDSVHTNELGAKVVARAIYEQLRPTLRHLSLEKHA